MRNMTKFLYGAIFVSYYVNDEKILLISLKRKLCI